LSYTTGFSLGSPDFLTAPQKPTFPNSNLITGKIEDLHEKPDAAFS